MSSVNIFVQGRRGYLLTDAVSSIDGIVVTIASKVVTVPSFRMVLSSRGNITASELADGINRCAPTSAMDIVELLPDIIVGVKSLDRVRYPADDTWAAIVYAMFFCTATRRPCAFLVADDGADLPASYEPYSVQPITDCIGPGIDLAAVLGRHANLTSPQSFDPERDGLAVMEAQRRQPAACIGGFAELTEVSAAGVNTRRLRDWPDKVGASVSRG